VNQNMKLELVVAGAVGAVVAYYFVSRRYRGVSVGCCPPGSLPSLQALSPSEAPPRGSEQQIGSITVYVTGCTDAARCVIIATDIWGFRAGRHRQVCDVIADSLSCKVLMPDFFHGDACSDATAPGTPRFAPWAAQWTAERLTEDLSAMYATIPSNVKLGFVGFCWGTFPAVLAAASGRVQAACLAHPSHRKIMEVVHDLSATISDAHVAGSKAATMVLAAGNDDPRCKPGGKDESLLRAAGVQTHFEEFKEMAHGWVIKGDLADADTADAVRKATGLMSGWLAEHL
jgi:dienelactone hydrolase